MKIFIASFFILITSCNSQSSEGKTEITKDTSSGSEKKTSMSLAAAGCYAYIIKEDSALLKLEIAGNKASGDLSYSLHEKDNNKGTIRGALQDSLLVADYTFQSEGMTSVRQVVFKVRGDSLIEGFGDIEMKGDTAKFKNVSQLQFPEERALIKTNCK